MSSSGSVAPPSKQEITRRLSIKATKPSAPPPLHPHVLSTPMSEIPPPLASVPPVHSASHPSAHPPTTGPSSLPNSHNLRFILEGPLRASGGRTFSDSENEAGDEGEEDEEDDDEDGYLEEDGEIRKKVEGERILRSGYLEKKGEKRKSWKKRWFVLRTGKLSYYKDNREYKLLRLIDLRDIHSTSLVQLKKHIAALGIVTHSRTFYVKASSSIEAENWVEAINAACRELKEMDEMEDGLKNGLNVGEPSGSRKQSRSGSNGVFSPPVRYRSPSLSGSSVGGGSFFPHMSPVLGPTVQTNAPAFPLGLNTTAPPFWTEPHAGSMVSSPIERQPPQSPTRTGVTSSSEDEDFEELSPPAVPLPITTPTFTTDPNKVILKAYLMKMGKRKNWRKRWFVLTSGNLMYSSSHMDTKPHRVIPLARILDALEYEPKEMTSRTEKLYPTSSSNYDLATSAELSSSPLKAGLHTAASLGAAVGVVGPAKTVSHAFKIITPKRVFIVCAPSEEEEIQWLSAIQTLIARRVAGHQAASALVGEKLNTPISLPPPLPHPSSTAQPIPTPTPAHIPTIFEQPPTPQAFISPYLPSSSTPATPLRTPSPSPSRGALSELANKHLPSIAAQISGERGRGERTG